MLDKTANPLYNPKAVKNAAIAQSVERILGKDEVASSNLASSSKFSPYLFDAEIFVFRAKLATSSAFQLRGRRAPMGPRPMGHGGQFAQIGKGTRQFTDQPISLETLHQLPEAAMSGT